MPIDAWPIDASTGAPSYSGQDLRFGTVTPFLAGAGASLGVRSGVRPSGSGTDMQVLAQASPNMSVRITPGVIVVQGAVSVAQGAYTWTNDSTITRTIAAAHATLARTDLVVVRIRDAAIDTSGGRDGDVIVITGTAGGGVPSLPTDATYVTIAQVAVPAAAASIVTGNITDKRPFTASTGGIIPCTSSTEPAATTVPPGQIVYRSDLGQYKSSDGASYRHLAWAPPFSFVRRTADAPSIATSTTLTDDAVLFLDVAPNAVYVLTSQLVYSADAGADLRVGWSAPAASTLDWNTASIDAVSSSASAGSFWGYSNLASAEVLGGLTGGTPAVGRPSGLLVTSAAAGQLKFRWAQGTSSGFGTQVKAGSWLRLDRVG